MPSPYNWIIDGACRPRLRKDHMAAEAAIQNNGAGKVSFYLITSEGAARHPEALASSDPAKHLWGECDENEGD
jgi:hypothetical protein